MFSLDGHEMPFMALDYDEMLFLCAGMLLFSGNKLSNVGFFDFLSNKVILLSEQVDQSFNKKQRKTPNFLIEYDETCSKHADTVKGLIGQVVQSISNTQSIRLSAEDQQQLQAMLASFQDALGECQDVMTQDPVRKFSTSRLFRTSSQIDNKLATIGIAANTIIKFSDSLVGLERQRGAYVYS